jgi:hypothetical protein
MERRDVLKLLASAGLTALSADELFWLQGVHSQVAKASGLKTLSAHQDATVTTVAELIIPQTETPGAKAAKVNEFIDVMLSDWCDEATAARFLAGLAGLDKRSQKLFSQKFIGCSEDNQKKLLTALDEEALAARRKETTRPGTPPAVFPMDFFSMFKKLTLIGYYTSAVGFKDELHKTIIPAAHKGCAPLEGEV